MQDHFASDQLAKRKLIKVVESCNKQSLPYCCFAHWAPDVFVH